MSLASETYDASTRKTPVSNLPFEQLFIVQIGNEIFKLSGASISSDG